MCHAWGCKHLVVNLILLTSQQAPTNSGSSWQPHRPTATAAYVTNAAPRVVAMQQGAYPEAMERALLQHSGLHALDLTHGQVHDHT